MNEVHKRELAGMLSGIRFRLENDISERCLELNKLSERQRIDKRKLAEVNRMIAKLKDEEPEQDCKFCKKPLWSGECDKCIPY